nr:hypothetical protein [Bacillus stercoris]
MFGMAMGGLLPCITAAIRVRAPGSIQGEVLGYNVSFRFLGNVLGPLLGGIISSILRFRPHFMSQRFSFSPALYALDHAETPEGFLRQSKLIPIKN